MAAAVGGGGNPHLSVEADLVQLTCLDCFSTAPWNRTAVRHPPRIKRELIFQDTPTEESGVGGYCATRGNAHATVNATPLTASVLNALMTSIAQKKKGNGA